MAKVIKHNIYNYEHKFIYEQYNENLEYCNDLEINRATWAVYKFKKKVKNKHFVLIKPSQNSSVAEEIQEKTKSELESFRLVDAIYCKNCETIVYSPHVHMMINCECKNVAIDGGSRYTKIAYKPEFSNFKMVVLDVITEIIIPEELV